MSSESDIYARRAASGEQPARPVATASEYWSTGNDMRQPVSLPQVLQSNRVVADQYLALLEKAEAVGAASRHAGDVYRGAIAERNAAAAAVNAFPHAHPEIFNWRELTDHEQAVRRFVSGQMTRPDPVQADAWQRAMSKATGVIEALDARRAFLAAVTRRQEVADSARIASVEIWRVVERFVAELPRWTKLTTIAVKAPPPLDRARAAVDAARLELTAIEGAPVPLDEALATMRADLDAKASGGAVAIEPSGRLEASWIFRDAISAASFAFWASREMIETRLTEQLAAVDRSKAISRVDRPSRIAAATRELRRAECEEEAAVRALEASGKTIDRRPGAHPESYLLCAIADQPAERFSLTPPGADRLEAAA